MLSFDVKIAKIGPADLQIICLREIIKDEEEKRKKLRRVKYIALSATFAERAKLIFTGLQRSRDKNSSTLHYRTRLSGDKVGTCASEVRYKIAGVTSHIVSKEFNFQHTVDLLLKKYRNRDI